MSKPETAPPPSESKREIPVQPQEVQDILIWDFDKREWVKGYRKDIARLPTVYELKWTNTGVNTDVAPDEDVIIRIERAQSVAIQADTTHPLNTSTSIDVNVEACVEEPNWDTVPYAEMNLGDAEVKTMLVNPGPLKIRLRVDNNAADTTGYVRAIVKVRE